MKKKETLSVTTQWIPQEAEIRMAMDEAFEQAKKASSEGEVPVGAVIFGQQGILTKAHNTRESLQDPTGHAEINAIREAARSIASWRLDTLAICITLEPCPMCLGALQQARILRVYYCAKDLKGGALSLGYDLHRNEKTNHRFQVEHFEDGRCSKILSEFFSAKRQAATPLK